MNDPHRVPSASVPLETDPDSNGRSLIPVSLLSDAIKQGVKEAVADEDVLLDYPELARRLKLGIRATKDPVNRGKITPALR